MAVSTHDTDVLNRIFNPELPFNDSLEDTDKQEDLNGSIPESEEVVQAKALEVEAVAAAEAGRLTAAQDLLNKAICLAPEWPSAYNNRAQVLRLQDDVPGALEDLNKAIELSQGKGKAACQAYTQRGIIHRLEGNNTTAREDLEQAARLGSSFAKQLAISLNPYAALCNQMLGEVMHRVRLGEQ